VHPCLLGIDLLFLLYPMLQIHVEMN